MKTVMRLMRTSLFLMSGLLIAPTFVKGATEIELYRNQAVKEIRPVLDEFIIKQFREYPYLYVYQSETNYNAIFEKDPQAFVLFATKNGVRIGTLQANPLNSPYFKGTNYTPAEALNQIKNKGYNPDKILYVTAFVMTKEERTNADAIKLLFDKAVELAKQMGKTQICYMEIVENKNHPLRPKNYTPLEPWYELDRKFKSMDVVVKMNWPTIQKNGKVKDEAHKMAFYITDV